MFLSFQYEDDEDLEIATEKSPTRSPLSKLKNKIKKPSYVDLTASNREKKNNIQGEGLFDEETVNNQENDQGKGNIQEKSIRNTYKTKYTQSSKRHQQKIDMIQASELENLLKTGLEDFETSRVSMMKEENKNSIWGRVKKNISEFVSGMIRITLAAFGLDSSKDALSLYWNRKIRLKYWIIVLILLVTIIPLTLLGENSIEYGNINFEIRELTDFVLNVKNCNVEFLDHQDEKFVNFDYQLNNLFTNTSRSFVSSRIRANSSIPNAIRYTFSIETLNTNLHSCKLRVFIPTSLLIRNMTVYCDGKCFFVSQSTNLTFQYLSMRRGHIYSNFLTLTVLRNFTYNTTLGIIQLNQFDIKNASILINNGDVILQTVLPFKLDWKNEGKTFCFSAPFVHHDNHSQRACQALTRLEQDSTTDSLPLDIDAELINNSTVCRGQTRLCVLKDCQPTNNLYVQQLVGNTYANLIIYDQLPKDFNRIVLFSDVYLDSMKQPVIEFDSNLMKNMTASKFKATNGSQADPIFIIRLQEKETRQSTFHLWIVTTNPAFSQMRPWWLAAFSASLLTTDTYKLGGGLSPGFCPYKSRLEKEDVFRIQQKITQFFNMSKAIVSFIKPGYQPSLNSNGTISGIVTYEKRKPVNEEWVYFDEQEGENEVTQLALINVSIDSNSFLISTVVISLIASFLIGIGWLRLFMIMVTIIYKNIVFASEHRHSYFEDERDQMKSDDDAVEIRENDNRLNVAHILRESSFSNFMSNVPRVSSFISYYSMILVKKYLLISVESFCHSLFREADPKELRYLEEGKSYKNLIEMEEKTLKHLYERYCFINHYSELRLSDNVAFFEKYGFSLVEDTASDVFDKIIEKKHKSIPDKEVLLNSDSLEIFLSTFYEITNLEIDYEYVEDLEERYHKFCKYYRLETKPFRPVIISQRYGLNILKKPKYKLKRLKKIGPVRKLNFFEKMINFIKKNYFKYVHKKSFIPFEDRLYVIDQDTLFLQSKIQNDPSILQKIEELQVFIDEKSVDCSLVTMEFKKNFAVKRMIFYPKWYFFEVLFISINITAIFLMVMPFLLLALQYEITYSDYSLIDEEYLLTLEEAIDYPWSVFSRVPTFVAWNICIVVICLIFAWFNFFEQVIFFWFSEFPEDKTFKKSQESVKRSKIRRFLANLQWLMIFFFILCYGSYIGLVLMWLLLGAIINPNNFLIYASASLTILTFISTKYALYQKISEEGLTAVKNLVANYLDRQMKVVVEMIVNRKTSEPTEPTSSNKLSEISLEKAVRFGLEKEVQFLKNYGEVASTNPSEKDSVNQMGAAVDPNTAIETLDRFKDQLISKAVDVFRKRCLAYNIPEEFIDILIDLCLQKKEDAKGKLSLLIEQKTSEVLNIKIPRDLIDSILSIVIKPEHVENNKETITLITQEIFSSVLDFSIRSALPEYQYSQGNLKKVAGKVLNLVQAVKTFNAVSAFGEIKDLIQNLQMVEPKMMALVLSLFELLECFLRKASPIEIKNAVKKILESGNFPEEGCTMVAMLMFSSPDEPLIEINNRTLETFDQYVHAFSKLIVKVRLGSIQNNLVIVCSKLAAFIFFLIKGKLAKSAIDDTVMTIYQFFIPQNKRRELPSPETICSLLNLIPIGMNIRVSLENRLLQSSSTQKFNPALILDFIKLFKSDDYKSLNITIKENAESLLKSKFVSFISTKVRMSGRELLGFIGLYRMQFGDGMVDEYLRKVLGFSGIVDRKVQEDLRQIIILAFSKDQSLLARALNHFQVDQSIPQDPGNVVKNEKITKLQEVEMTIINIGSRTNLKENVDTILARVRNGIYNTQKINELFNILKGLFSLRLYEDTIKMEAEIKTNLNQFANFFNYNNTSFEHLIHLLMNNKGKLLESLLWFLKDDLNISKQAISQILKVIQIQESISDPAVLKEALSGIIPEKLKKYVNIISDLLKSKPSATNLSNYSEFFMDMIELLINDTSAFSEDEKQSLTKIISKILNFKDINSVEGILELFPIFETDFIPKEFQEKMKLLVEIFLVNKGSISTSLPSLLKELFFKEQESITTDNINQIINFLSLLISNRNTQLIDSAEFLDYFKNKYGINFEYVKALKFYFNTDPQLFGYHFTRFFKSIHGLDSIEADSLYGILSLFTEAPKFELIEKHLKIPSFATESIITFCKIYSFSSNQESNYDDLKTSFIIKKWCSKLGLYENELILLMKMFHQSITWKSLPSFYTTFGISKYINNEVFFGMLSLFPRVYKDPSNENKQKAYQYAAKARGSIYKILGINQSFCDLLLEIQRGNPYNIFLQLNSDPGLRNVFVNNTHSKLPKIIAMLLGSICCSYKSNLNIQKLAPEFSSESFPLDNDLSTVAYLLYTEIGMPAVLFLFGIGHSKAIDYLLEQSPDGSDNLEQILQGFDSAGLDNVNYLVEMEWLIALNDQSGYSNSKKKGSKWYCEWTECRDKMENCLQKIKKSFNFSKKKTTESLMQFIQNEYTRHSHMGFQDSETKTSKLKSYPFLAFSIISCVRKLRLFFSLRDAENSWENVCSFAFHCDLLLTIIEKVYYLSDEFSYLDNYNKRMIVRMMTLSVYYKKFYSQTEVSPDYIYDIFIRPSLFDQELEIIWRKVLNNLTKLEKNASLTTLRAKSILDSDYIISNYLINGGKVEQILKEYLKKSAETTFTFESLLSTNQATINRTYLWDILRKIVDFKNESEDIYKTVKFQIFDLVKEKEEFLESLLENMHGNQFSSIISDTPGFFSKENIDCICKYSLYTLEAGSMINLLDFIGNKEPNAFHGNLVFSKGLMEHLILCFKVGHKENLAFKFIEDTLNYLTPEVKSNLGNLKLLLTILKDPELDNLTTLKEFLASLEINQLLFYAISVPYLINKKNSKKGLKTFHMPKILKRFLEDEQRPAGKKKSVHGKQILAPSKSKTILLNNDIKLMDKGQEEKSVILGNLMTYLLSKSNFREEEKKTMNLIINCFLGEKEAWKQFLDLENIDRSGTIRAVKSHLWFLIDLLPFKARKIYDEETLDSSSFMDFISSSFSWKTIFTILERKFMPREIYDSYKDDATDMGKIFILILNGIIKKDYSEIMDIFFSNSRELKNVSKLFNLTESSIEFKIVKFFIIIMNISQGSKFSITQIKEELIDWVEENEEDIEKIFGKYMPKDFLETCINLTQGRPASVLKFLCKRDSSALFFCSIFFITRLSTFLTEYIDMEQDKKRRSFSLVLMVGVVDAACLVFENYMPAKSTITTLKTVMAELRPYISSNYLDEAFSYMYKMSALKREGTENNWFNPRAKELVTEIIEDLNWLVIDDPKFSSILEPLKQLIEEIINPFVSEAPETVIGMLKSMLGDCDEEERNFFENSIKCLVKLFYAFSGNSKSISFDVIRKELIPSFEPVLERLVPKGGNYISIILQIIIMGVEMSEKIKQGTHVSIGAHIKTILDFMTQVYFKENEELASTIFGILTQLIDSKIELKDLQMTVVGLLNKILKKIFKSDKSDEGKNNKVDIVFEETVNSLNFNDNKEKSAGEVTLFKMIKEKDKKQMEIKNSQTVANVDNEQRNDSQIGEIAVHQSVNKERLINKYNFLGSKHIKSVVEVDREASLFISLEEILGLSSLIYEYFSKNDATSEEKRLLLFEIADKIGKTLFPEEREVRKIIKNLFHLVEGEIEQIGPELFLLLNIDFSKQELIKSLMIEFREIIKGPQDYINMKAGRISQRLIGTNLGSIQDIMKKISGKENLSFSELFKIIDTDRSGKINMPEYKLLTNRLGMSLSDHRIKEIFTSVKMQTGSNATLFDLDENEFSLSIQYLQTKSVQLALESLGITSEILTIILIMLVLLLVIIMVFIFVGVRAFAVGGTFGAIVNSLFPIAGGVVVGKKDERDNLNTEKLKETVEKCLKIVQSMRI